MVKVKWNDVIKNISRGQDPLRAFKNAERKRISEESSSKRGGKK